MPDITLKGVPWAPATNVGAYPRRSEITSSDGPPSGAAVQTKAVAADASLTYTALPAGEYWAAALLGSTWQYVAFNLKAEGSRYDREPGLPGMICLTHDGAMGPIAPVTDQLNLTRFVPTRDIRVSKLRVPIQAASAVDAAIQAGIYDSTLASLLAASAQTSGLITSPGVKSLAAGPYTLIAGTVYYAAVVFHGGDASLRTIGWSLGSFLMSQLLGTGVPPDVLGTTKAATWPLPAAVVAPLSPSATLPVVAVAES